MKSKLIRCLPVFIALTSIISSCKKATEALQTPIEQAQIAAHSDDDAMISDELDALTSDANTLIEADASLSGDASVVDAPICDATVELNVESDPMTLTVNFNGGNCGAKYTRTGVVVLSMAKDTKWKDAGAAITINYQDFKITRKSDNKSITFNGTQLYTNVSGGLLFQAASAGTIIHTITGENLLLKFDNGDARTWNMARKKEFTYNDGLVISVSGIGTVGEVTNAAEWGSNRFGNDFITSITSPLVLNQACDFRIGGGTVQHKTDAFTASVTFGLDASGASTGCPGSGNYYYKLDWTRSSNGNHFDIILPY
jgi:hypothetical protein